MTTRKLVLLIAAVFALGMAGGATLTGLLQPSERPTVRPIELREVADDKAKKKSDKSDGPKREGKRRPQAPAPQPAPPPPPPPAPDSGAEIAPPAPAPAPAGDDDDDDDDDRETDDDETDD